MSQPNQTDDQQNSLARAEFFRALADAWHDGMPMPFQVYFGAAPDNAVQMRYRSAEEVDACVVGIGGTAVHDDHSYEADNYHPDGWHGYGTSYPHRGGRSGQFAGLIVNVWAALEGPTPTTEDGAR